ncbi:embryo-specific protein ATS3B-like isoform X1 [Cicer arietinum]|uniref:Embryo-specific protein ATS3B-like isoform X2 n=1 Tax=Cicer arietinum TaxID=3827 RepID=A0A1S3E8A5_CICAR|nr:embryo-specific protein ATS3B-like isoform X2 [Cicer arietinum]
MKRKKVSKIMKTLTLILTFSVIVLSHATPTLLTRIKPQMKQSSALDDAQLQNLDKLNCNYRVAIKTSCLSPLITNDRITLLFGNATRYETVYVENVGGPNSKTRLEPCKTDVLDLEGPCGYNICKVLIYRSRPHNGVRRPNDDRWIVESVTIDDYRKPPITFYYKPNYIIPDDGFGYGPNYCHRD